MLIALRHISVPAGLVLLCLLAGSAGLAQEEDAGDRQTRLEDLGRALFFDVNLSRRRGQSCATCHDPARAFIDPRGNGVAGAASLGDDGMSLGDRNAPTASYAAEAPAFHRAEAGEYTGGQFLDGRAADLVEQAGQPLLNPIEMAMPGRAGVIERLRANPQYVRAFRNLFGADILSDTERVYTAMAEAIAAFERTDFFSPYDSKYDRYLEGEYEPTRQEELGMTLFFSEQFTNCNQCHQLKARPAAAGETFTNYQYRNIGVPANEALRRANGLGADHVDRGLLENPAVDDPAQKGKFKVPTLRNVAVTGPYMHNGVFQGLRTVVLFYNKFNLRTDDPPPNPETGEPWRAPEVPENIALEELEMGSALDDRRIDALVAFMEMLTDQRYEHLLEDTE